MSELSRQQRSDIRSHQHRAAYERGEFPYSLFPTRQDAMATAFVCAACITMLAGMVTHSVYADEKQKRQFDTQGHDTTGWPECTGRQLYWRDHCVVPK